MKMATSSSVPPVGARPAETVSVPTILPLPVDSPQGLEVYWEDAQRPTALEAITEGDLDERTAFLELVRACEVGLRAQITVEAEAIDVIKGAQSATATAFAAVAALDAEGEAEPLKLEEEPDELPSQETALQTSRDQFVRIGAVIKAMDARLLAVRQAREARLAAEERARKEREARETRFANVVAPALQFLTEKSPAFRDPKRRDVFISGLEGSVGIVRSAGEKKAQEATMRTEAQRMVGLFLDPAQKGQVSADLSPLLETEQANPRLTEGAGKVEIARKALETLRLTQGVSNAVISRTQGLFDQAEAAFKAQFSQNLTVALEQVAFNYLQSQPPALEAVLQPMQPLCVEDPKVLARAEAVLFGGENVETIRVWAEALTQAFVEEGELPLFFKEKNTLSLHLRTLFENAVKRLASSRSNFNSGVDISNIFAVSKHQTGPEFLAGKGTDGIATEMLEACQLPDNPHMRELLLALEASSDLTEEQRGGRTVVELLFFRKLFQSLGFREARESSLPTLLAERRDHVRTELNSSAPQLGRVEVLRTLREMLRSEMGEHVPSAENLNQVMLFLWGNGLDRNRWGNSNMAQEVWNQRVAILYDQRKERMFLHSSARGGEMDPFVLFRLPGLDETFVGLQSTLDRSAQLLQGTPDQDWAALKAKVGEFPRVDTTSPLPPLEFDSTKGGLLRILSSLEINRLCEVQVTPDSSCPEGAKVAVGLSSLRAGGRDRAPRDDVGALSSSSVECFATSARAIVENIEKVGPAELEVLQSGNAVEVWKALNWVVRKLKKDPTPEWETSKQGLATLTATISESLRPFRPDAYTVFSNALDVLKKYPILQDRSRDLVSSRALDQKIEETERRISELQSGRTLERHKPYYDQAVALIDRQREESRLLEDVRRSPWAEDRTLTNLRDSAKEYVEDHDSNRKTIQAYEAELKLLKDLRQAFVDFSTQTVESLRARLCGQEDGRSAYSNINDVVEYCRKNR